MSTFTEDQGSVPSTTTQPQQQQQQQQHQVSQRLVTSDQEASTPLGIYMNSLTSQYQEKIKRMAQYSNYNLELRWENGKQETINFTRMKLLQWQFDEIEDLRALATELSNPISPNRNAIEAQKALKTMYRKTASYILWNTKTQQPMSDDEYRHCEFSEVRPALDASLLLSLVSDANLREG